MNPIIPRLADYRAEDEALFQQRQRLVYDLYPILNIEGVGKDDVRSIEVDSNLNVTVTYCRQNWGDDYSQVDIPHTVLESDDLVPAWKSFTELAKQAKADTAKANQLAADMARARELQARYPGAIVITDEAMTPRSDG